MSGRLRPTRYAHSEGHTDVCYSQDGKLLITCGEDGDVRVFEGLDDDDCLTHNVGDVATAVAFKFPQLVVASDTNLVQMFDPEDGAPGQVVTRFTACPTCIDISGNYIAAGGSDMVVRVHDCTLSRDTLFEGHAAPILSVALDPKGEYVCSSSCDGSIKVWLLISGEAVKTWPDALPKTNRFSAASSLARMTFSKTGDYLMVPLGDKVAVFTRGSWSKEREMGLSNSTSPVSLTTLSPCGTLVAVSTTDGSIGVLEAATGAVVLSLQHPKKITITGLVWHPTDGGQLAFVDKHGQLGTVVDIAVCTPSPAFPPLDVDADIDTLLDDINKGAADDDDDNDVSIAAIKSQMGFADDEHGTFLGLPQKTDDATSALAPPSPGPLSTPAPPPPGVQLPELQRTFSPSMTPEHHAQRYMLWNSTGVIKQYNTEGDCSIGVDFHDSSLHHSIHLVNSDHPSYSLAALSDQALVLAAEATNHMASRVSVQLLQTGSGDSQDWVVELPEAEDVTAVAASSSVVVIASDRRVLRVLSIGGVSREVLTIPGPLVCLAAHQHQVMVLYHGGVGAAGDQQIQCMLLHTSSSSGPHSSQQHKHEAPFPVALAPKAYVSWAGYSDEGTPVVADSEGYVRLLHHTYSGVWAVVLATKEMTKGRSDHHFLLGVSERERQVRSILCKGSRYPAVVPPPYVSLLDYKVPVLDGSSEKGELESSVLSSEGQLATLARLQLTTDVAQPIQEAEMVLQTSLIKLFALSCRSGRLVRASDVCRLMTERTMTSAIKYAAKQGREQLAEEVADQLTERRERDQQERRLSRLSSHNMTLDLTLPAPPQHTPAGDETLSLTPAGTLHQPPTAADDAGALPPPATDDYDGDDGRLTPDIASSNPLLAARGHARIAQYTMEETPVSATKMNPFKRSSIPSSSSCSADPSKKGFKALDVYKPKADPAAPILRPVLKKKSKADRGVSKLPRSSVQPAIQSKLPKAFTTANPGKENRLGDEHTETTSSPNVGKKSCVTTNGDGSSLPKDQEAESSDSLTADQDAETPEQTSDTAAGLPLHFRDSSMFKSSIAMHLWWADNDALVRGTSDTEDFRTLVPRAAVLFKDLGEEEKVRYKKLASDKRPLVTAEVKSNCVESNKRKRPDEEVEDDAPKKPKAGSGISKLAAFAFNGSH